jgi:hypothetical protein
MRFLAALATRWFCRFTRWLALTLPCRSYPVGTPRFSHLTSWLEPFSAASDGVDAADSGASDLQLERLITPRHLDNMCKIILATGSMVGLAYTTEFFMAWYSQNPYEFFTFWNRAFGPYWWAYWAMFLCNVISPQLFWFRVFRTNTVLMWIVTIFVNIGMWFERFVITVTSLSRDFLPSSWGYFADVGGYWYVGWQFRTVHDAFPALLPVLADRGDQRSQGCDESACPRRASTGARRGTLVV